MTHVSLFTGIGGLDLAAEAAGFETVLQVEREPYALRVLERHWPEVPRITDVREVTSESVDRPITVVSGGFPCQPFSAAGKRRGADDDRYLWPELLRIVEELQPSWVIGENVSGLLSIDGGLEIDRMLAALEARDYAPWVLHYPAAGVGAPHKRDRVFIVAHRSQHGQRQRRARRFDSSGARERESERTFQDVAHAPQHMRDGGGGTRRRRNEHSNGSQDVADTEEPRLEGWSKRWYAGQEQPGPREGGRAIQADWSVEPDVGRVANGVSNRVDRLKALGNAVVPAQAYPIFAAIAHAEAAA